jgi:hypothetical protein
MLDFVCSNLGLEEWMSKIWLPTLDNLRNFLLESTAEMFVFVAQLAASHQSTFPSLRRFGKDRRRRFACGF